MHRIKRFEARIVAEEKLAREANSPDIASAHQQVAMLYRSELAILQRKRAASVAETLADIW